MLGIEASFLSLSLSLSSGKPEEEEKDNLDTGFSIWKLEQEGFKFLISKHTCESRVDDHELLFSENRKCLDETEINEK